MDRLVIVPDEQFQPLLPALKARLAAIGEEVNAENLNHLMGQESMRSLFAGAHGAEDRELLVWARSARVYLAAWTSLAGASEAGAVTADSKSGLVNQIFASGRPALQSSDELQASTWTNCEDNRGQIIRSVAGAPVFLFGRCSAVLTLVEYTKDKSTRHLCHKDLAELSALASLFGRLLEDHLIRALLGLEMS